MGTPDFGEAIRRGMMGARESMDTMAKPKQLAESLLAMKLKNEHDKIKNQFLPRGEEARIGGQEESRLATHILNQYRDESERLRIQGLQQTVAKNKYDNDLTQQLANAFQGEGVDVPASQSNSQDVSGAPNPNENMVNPGNPELYKIDKLYDSMPQLRKKIESMGYKRTQQTKIDPKTGAITTVTTHPSGKVTVSSTTNPDAEFTSNTAAVKSKAENTINGIDNAIPIIDGLIAKVNDIPGRLIGQYLSPNKEADYEADIAESAETFANAFGYPNTDKGYEQAEKVVRRRNGEGDKAYKARLEKLKTHLQQRKGNAQSVLHKGTALKAQASKKELQPYTQKDIEDTAKQYGISVLEVKQKLGVQ
jgi:hypothetical protein